MSVLDHPLITQRYFFPRPKPPDEPFLVPCGGVRLACVRRQAHADAGWVVVFHGNGEVAADYEGFADELVRLGVNVCLAEYRGYGGSTGTAALAAMLDDGDRIVQALGAPDERLAVFGRSIGSLYAIELASRRPRVAGLVLESGIADVLERVLMRVTPEELGCTREELAAAVDRSFDHRAKLGAYAGPVLVLHAAQDRLVEASNGESLHRWAGGRDKELVLFPRGDHNSIFVMNYLEYLERLGAFFRRIGLTAAV